MTGEGTPRKSAATPVVSPRREALLELAYRYVLANGATDLSLRPLAASTGTSPRVLLYLFGSKDGLVREILARARAEQTEMLRAAVAVPDRESDSDGDGDPGSARDGSASLDRLWSWLSAPEQRDTVRLFVEAYARSLHPDPGPWDRFAQTSVEEWLQLFDELTPAPAAARTLTLAVLRGLLHDLLATGDLDRVDAAYRRYRASIAGEPCGP
jgi:AcrR family transcriptional regulator